MPNQEELIGPNVALVDIDGTIGRTKYAISQDINRQVKLGRNERVTVSDFTRRRKEDPRVEAAYRRFYKDPDAVGRCLLFVGALEGLQLLSEAGSDIHIVSLREQGLHPVTYEWLARKGVTEYVPKEQIHLGAPEKGVDFKTGVAREVGGTVAFDDTLDMVKGLAEMGVMSYLITSRGMERIRDRDSDRLERVGLICPRSTFLRAVLHLLSEESKNR